MKESLEHQKYKAGFAATWMHIRTVILSEVSQTEKEMSSDIPYIWNLKRSDTNQLTKQNRLTESENKFMFTRRKDGGRDSKGVWDVHTAIFKMDNQQGPTVQHINSAQCYVATWIGGQFW